MSEKVPIGLRQTNNESRVDKHPFHLASKFGCYHGRKLENPDLDLNFVKHGENIKTKHTTSVFFNPKTWIYYSKISNDDVTYSIEGVFDLIVCNDCCRTLEYWHTQRQIFLPKIADELEVETINEDDFTSHDLHQGSCDACGTAKSATETLQENIEKLNIDSPLSVCLTCKELLVESTDELRIQELELSDHPKNTSEKTHVTTPTTDPKYDPQEKVKTENTRDYTLDEFTE